MDKKGIPSEDIPKIALSYWLLQIKEIDNIFTQIFST